MSPRHHLSESWQACNAGSNAEAQADGFDADGARL